MIRKFLIALRRRIAAKPATIAFSPSVKLQDEAHAASSKINYDVPTYQRRALAARTHVQRKLIERELPAFLIRQAD